MLFAPTLADKAILPTAWGGRYFFNRIGRTGVVSENGIYGHSRFCNTDFDDKLACLNLSGV
uniref:Uncharacterized protein n=2 Tax=Enterobacteriaceae TaxID=543 RepID=A0A2R4NF68_KLEPN|nr:MULTISPECIES: hypothetical protein [Enterobacteriaceae]AVX34792.1 hypothetical protein [Klebsiella pneumoniae]QEQ69285.1 hypothetical protein [Enterobacter cloacae]